MQVFQRRLLCSMKRYAMSWFGKLIVLLEKFAMYAMLLVREVLLNLFNYLQAPHPTHHPDWSTNTIYANELKSAEL
eukprot:3936694-Amphidinium_carterae.1